eukprot:scaffold4606_cov93-Phaeocystis_antarctica.AAC.2
MSFIPLEITPARQPGCQRHARGTLWQYPCAQIVAHMAPTHVPRRAVTVQQTPPAVYCTDTGSTCVSAAAWTFEGLRFYFQDPKFSRVTSRLG